MRINVVMRIKVGTVGSLRGHGTMTFYFAYDPVSRSNKEMPDIFTRFVSIFTKAVSNFMAS